MSARGAVTTLAMATSLAACGVPGPDTGFVRIVASYALGPTGHYILGQEPLPSLSALRSGDTTVRAIVGTPSLQLSRDGKLFPLCSVPVRKNRITTVTLVVSTPSSGVRCQIES